MSLPFSFSFFFFSFLLFTTQVSANSLTDSLDSTIRYYAFKELTNAKTGILYRIPLPSNLSGIQASAIRLRRGSFYLRGANFTGFEIPSKIISVPHVQRLVFVYQNLGNLSSFYYRVPGYFLVSPVIGFLVYNASDTSSNSNSTTNELTVNTTRKSIVINFPEINLSKEMNSSRVKCARFGRNGSVQIGETVAMSACLATSSGHFAVVVPSGGLAPGPWSGEGRRRWWIWVVVGGGLVVVLVVIGVGILKLVRNKKRELMEGSSNEGVVLGSVWVNGESKMPAAEMVRTQPVIETDTVP